MSKKKKKITNKNPVFKDSYGVVSSNAFDMATETYRAGDWVSMPTNINEEVRNALPIMAARARDLVQNNEYISRAHKSLTADFVNTGIKPNANSGDTEINSLVEKVWAQWVNQCMIGIKKGYYPSQATSIKGMITVGESFMRRRIVTGSRAPLVYVNGRPVRFPLKIQALPSRMIYSDMDDDKNNISGIKFDDNGEAVGYWMYKNDPLRNGSYDYEPVLISASDIAHMFIAHEEAQVRGYSWISAVANNARSMSDWLGAELDRKKTESSLAMIVTGGIYEQEIGEDNRPISRTVTDGAGRMVSDIEPASIMYVENGKTIETIIPKGIRNFHEAVSTYLMGTAAGMMMSYERMTGDLNKASFSAAKFGDIIYKKYIRHEHAMTVIPGICQPVWDWFIAAGQMIEIFPNIPIPATWTPPKFESIEPLKDAKADELLIKMKVKTTGDAIVERGGNAEDQYERWKQDQKLQKKFGLITDTENKDDSKSTDEDPAK